jgi:hypothetical protein
VAAGEPVYPAEKTFVQQSDERFGQYQRGIGDFGVGEIDAARAALQDLVVEMGTVAQQVYGVIGSVAGSFDRRSARALRASSIARWIGPDALRNIGSGVVQSIIQSFADMAAAWITKQLIMFALGQKLEGGGQRDDRREGRCRRGCDGPAAATASIASFGAAAAIGLALVLGAMAIFGGFAEGGLDGARAASMTGGHRPRGRGRVQPVEHRALGAWSRGPEERGAAASRRSGGIADGG